jgi:two-component system phosphate regulon sensor histidine kinase PhoR
MFWRLAISYTALILAALGLLGAVVVGRVERGQLDRIAAELRGKAVLVREAVRNLPSDSALQERVKALEPDVGARITLLADDGHVLADSEEDPAQMGNHGDRPEVRQARADRFGGAIRYSRTLRQSVMYAVLRADGEGGVRFVRIALPLEDVRQQSAALRRLVGVAALLTGLAASALSFWLARRTARPLRELATTAGYIAEGAFGRKVAEPAPAEVAALARAFNHMSDRLAGQFAQLEEDRQQLHAILSGMAEGVVALDADQRVLFANDRAYRLLGLSAKAAAGRPFPDVVSHPVLRDAARQALAHPEPYCGELTIHGPALRSLTVQAVRISGPPARGAVLVLHDTTELRRLERLRQEFAANVSHELKTPLAVIKAAVETLLDGADDDPAARELFLGQIDDQADRLHALILDLLSLARIEAGAEVLEFHPIRVGDAVAACLERHRTRAEAKGLALAAQPPGAGEVIAWADADALDQILDNLIDNAVKYTAASGRIRVSWRAEGPDVYLAVEDTGVGIPEPDLPRVFERFYRVDKARSRELGGTGLGLSIVKHLAQSMGGGVSAASTLGQGTTFTVRLPRPPAE